MSFTLISFVLEVVASLLAGAALLRVYLNHQRLPMNGPIARLVMTLTDWAVLPMRRMLPLGQGRVDLASVLLALLVMGVQVGVLMIWVPGGLAVWALLTVGNTVQLIASLITAVLILYALGSWFRMEPQMHSWLARVCEPMLGPVRRVLPNLGGIDLSPMVVVLLVQLLSRSVGYWQAQMMLGAMGI